MEPMTQTAPYPEILEEIIQNLEYRPGWHFDLQHLKRGQGSEGLTLAITTVGYDTYHPERGENYRVLHYMSVPPAAYNKQSWIQWVFDQILLIERHEACEFFRINGERIHAPQHGPGNDPYIVFTHGDDIERRTTYKGEVVRK